MTNLLVVNSSFRENSASNLLTAEFAKNWQAKFTNGKIQIHDLRTNLLPHLSENLASSIHKNFEDLTIIEQTSLALARKIINDVKLADLLVLGVPTYNFNLPSSLKAWIDHLTISGETFKYERNGPKGLLNEKKVLVLSTIGGTYPNNKLDFQTPYLQAIFEFIGITDLTFIGTQSLDMGDQIRSQNLNSSYQKIKQFVDSL